MGCSSIFKKMKEAEVSAHYWHLTTDNYAKHVAFKEFYEAMRDIADKYAEQSLGSDPADRMEVPPMLTINPGYEDALSMLSSYLEVHMMGVPLDKQDILVNAKQAVNELRYKLRLS